MTSTGKALQLAQQLSRTAPVRVVAKPQQTQNAVQIQIPESLKDVPRHLFESVPIEKLVKQRPFLEFPDWCASPSANFPGVHFDVEKQQPPVVGGGGGAGEAAPSSSSSSSMKLPPLMLNRFPFYLIGNSQSVCDMTMEHPSISRVHLAVVHHQSGRVCISDVNSSNGVFLNGKRISPGTYVPIQEGDVVKLGVSSRNLILRMKAPIRSSSKQENLSSTTASTSSLLPQAQQQQQQQFINQTAAVEKESGVRRERQEDENNNSTNKPPSPKIDEKMEQEEAENNNNNKDKDKDSIQQQESASATTADNVENTKVHLAHLLIKHKDVDAAVSKAPRNKGEAITRSLTDAIELAKAIHEQLASSNDENSFPSNNSNTDRKRIFLKSKSDFDEAVKKFSECSSTKKNGDMGVIEKGSLPNLDEFEATALSLAPLEISSDVVVTHLGVHILLRVPDE